MELVEVYSLTQYGYLFYLSCLLAQEVSYDVTRIYTFFGDEGYR